VDPSCFLRKSERTEEVTDRFTKVGWEIKITIWELDRRVESCALLHAAHWPLHCPNTKYPRLLQPLFSSLSAFRSLRLERTENIYKFAVALAVLWCLGLASDYLQVQVQICRCWIRFLFRTVKGITLAVQRMRAQNKTVFGGIKVPFSELSESSNFMPYPRPSEHIREGVGG
jgi:hypothetical protein